MSDRRHRPRETQPVPGVDSEAEAPDGIATPEVTTALRWGRTDALGLAVVTLVLALPVAGLMRYQGPPMEEGFMLAFPEQILNGSWPHRDFLHLYGPGSLWVLAAVYKVLGVSLTVERSVGLLQHAAVAYGLFVLLRPFGRVIATSSAVVSVLVLIGPLGLSAMAWNGALAFGIWGLVAGTTAARRYRGGLTDRRWLVPLAGVLSGIALLYRPDLVLAVGLGLAALWFDLPPQRRRPLLWGTLGALALYVPHVLISGVGDSFRGMFLEPVFQLRGGRSLPVPPSWGEVDGFLQRAGVLRTSGWPFPMPALSQQIFLWFALIPLSIALVVFAAWRLRRREPGSERAIALWAPALFSAALLQQAVQRPDTAHLSWVTGITFALAIPAIASLVASVRPAWPSAAGVALGIGTVVVVLVAVIPFYPLRTYVDLVGQSAGRNRFGFPITNDGRTFYYGSAEAAADAQAVVDSLRERAEPGDSVIVGPVDLSRTNYSDSFFYYLFPDLVPGTRYIEMDPGIADADDSGLADELERNDWLILSDAWSGWTEPNDSAGHGSDAANRVVAEHYCPVTDAGTFRLLERCR